MPRKLRRVSAFFKILTVVTVVCGALVGVGFYVMRSVKPLDVTPPPPPEGCTVSAGKKDQELEPEQAANAATVSGVAFNRDLPQRAIVIAFATVQQESKFYNVEYGDRDSVGLFQQRPSQKWGTPEQLMDPVYATGAFYDKLTQVSGYQEIPVYEAAQAVQRSADGFAYDQHEDLARTLTAGFSGAEGPAVTCWFDADTSSAKSDVAAAEEELARVFGVDPGAFRPGAKQQTGDLGWAMAIWAMAHAEEYGLTSVTYQDQRWTAGRGKQGWVTIPEADAAPEGRVVLG